MVQATDKNALPYIETSVETLDDCARACKAIPAPVLVIWGGPLPAPSPEEYQRAGVRIALYPTVAATSGMNAAWRVMNDLKSYTSRCLNQAGFDEPQRKRRARHGSTRILFGRHNIDGAIRYVTEKQGSRMSVYAALV